MNRKIIGIFVITLLISAAIPIVTATENGYNVNKMNSYIPTDVPPKWLNGADQYQTEENNYGMVISPVYHVAQEFKPTKEDLTAVALYFFNRNAPSNTDITVSIRESLDGSDLAKKTIDADSKRIKAKGTWVLFDFDDITIIPEETYYIMCYASSGGEVNNTYCWFFDIGNKYDRGIAWASNDSGETWIDLEDPFHDDPDYSHWIEIDLCFITYYLKPKSTQYINPLLKFLENHPRMFPLLRQLLNL